MDVSANWTAAIKNNKNVHVFEIEWHTSERTRTMYMGYVCNLLVSIAKRFLFPFKIKQYLIQIVIGICSNVKWLFIWKLELKLNAAHN